MIKYLLWHDEETTGLEPHTGAKPIEVGFRLTDLKLNTLYEYERVLHFGVTEAGELQANDPFIYNMHTENGLLAECAESSVTVDEVEIEICQFLDGLEVDDTSEIILAGSTIHFDKKWLEWFMPKVLDRLHYRIFDISTFYTVFDILGIEREPSPKVHRAMRDIDRSIHEFSEMLRILGTREW